MFHSVRRFSSEAMSQIRLCEAYAKLGLEEGAENVKERFLKLAKKYHPDSGSVEASADKFIEVKKAYELIVRNTESTDDQIDVDELVEKTIYDIRHKAPQHRQYLEFEGYGIGTPSQRHKQYQQYRVARAVERASEFVVDKAWAQDSLREDEKNQLVSKGVSRAEAYYAKKQKTTNLIDRMVEDMIQSSMQQGGFRNLKGAGKPLRKDETNPYIDDMEMRINKILIRNGFSPPWIMKETEIRDELQYLRDEIRLERAVFVKTGQAGEARWNATVERLRSSLEKVNKAIRDFNLIVPSLNRQIFPLSADRELQKAEEDVTTGGSESKWMARAEKLLAKREAVAPLQEEKINVFGDFVRELGRIWRMNSACGCYRLKSTFDLEESDFVPSVCMQTIDIDNPFVQDMIWRSAKEINDKFDDEFYLIPLQTIGAKRNACVAGYEYLFEFKVFQSVHIKTERSFDELRDAALEFTGNDQVLRCKVTVYKEPFSKSEQFSIESCKNV